MNIHIPRISQGQRRQKGEETKEAIGFLMKGIAASPQALMDVVARGPFEFRLRFLREMRGYAVNDDIANSVYAFFCQQVVNMTGLADAQDAAGQYLDKVEVKTAPTQAEIDASWVHEVFSSEDGRRHMYQDGAGMAGESKVIIH